MKTKEVLTEETKRILLLKTNEGELKVTIPNDAKITFGPSIPYAKKNDFGRVADYSLRIYKGTKENLIAVFAGVYSFRDITIPVQKLVVREAGKSIWKSDEEGYEFNQEKKFESNWVPDVKLLNE